ncbi:MAG: alpha/beta hydrolase [Candidatus Nanopelagicales bacterium]
MHEAAGTSSAPEGRGPMGPRGPFLGGQDVTVGTGDGVTLVATRWPAAPGDIGPVTSSDRAPGRVLLLHGLSQQRRFWRPVLRHLAGVERAAVDQRGHGDSGRPARPQDGGPNPYAVDRCADDVAAALDALGWDDAVVVGHSWGAAVALAAAARHPDRTAAAVAIDGGVTTLADLGPQHEVRQRLTPPRIELPPAEVEPMLRSGPLAGWWTDDVRDALLPTFEVGDDGLARTRLGFQRHMAVLDGLLDHDPSPVLDRVACPAWVVACAPVERPGGDPYGDAHWRLAREEGQRRAAALLARPRLQRWEGALHDVPLQWPALVAGLVRAAAEEAYAGSGSDGGDG